MFSRDGQSGSLSPPGAGMLVVMTEPDSPGASSAAVEVVEDVPDEVGEEPAESVLLELELDALDVLEGFEVALVGVDDEADDGVSLALSVEDVGVEFSEDAAGVEEAVEVPLTVEVAVAVPCGSVEQPVATSSTVAAITSPRAAGAHRPCRCIPTPILSGRWCHLCGRQHAPTPT
ncbi:hypothetical protein ACMYYO_03115 [Dermacoccaceae bacterium W4C1]